MTRQDERQTKGPALPALIVRAAWFFALWFALAGFDPADLPAALAAIAAASAASVYLLPPGAMRPSLIAIAGLALRFLKQSIVAGADVAWRALSPSMPLRPGFATYEPRLPQGPARSAFLTLMSLLPGSLPAWQQGDGTITIHCLDVDQPVAAQMAEEERLFIRALGVDPNDD